MSKLKAIRGMNDILPEQSALWQYLENTVKSTLQQYGYQEIRLPIVEHTELFKRSIGDVTDIVEKEMYTFKDRNDESLSLRPEGTAGCVRAAQEHGLLYNQTQRLWYAGPMFRYEKPQKGRYRQFHQIGIETFGWNGPDIDAEIIALTARLWEKLGIADKVELQLNSIGSLEARQNYQLVLVDYLNQNKDKLDEDSIRRLDKNPMRILDSKNPDVQAALDDAPKLEDFLDEDATLHFEQLKQRLDAIRIPYVINPRLVRGLDYYNHTVFEWVTDSLGAQGTICAGGRYDGLVKQLGGRETPAVGCAMGVERLLLMLEHLQTKAQLATVPHIYCIAQGENAALFIQKIAEQVRTINDTIRVIQHCGGGKFKTQMKKADQSGATLAFIVGDTEVENQQISVKFLRETKEQITVSAQDLESALPEWLN